jgi:hypothetical protein
MLNWDFNVSHVDFKIKKLIFQLRHALPVLQQKNSGLKCPLFHSVIVASRWRPR